jgi:hypothetical protein
MIKYFMRRTIRKVCSKLRGLRQPLQNSNCPQGYRCSFKFHNRPATTSGNLGSRALGPYSADRLTRAPYGDNSVTKGDLATCGMSGHFRICRPAGWFPELSRGSPTWLSVTEMADKLRPLPRARNMHCRDLCRYCPKIQHSK